MPVPKRRKLFLGGFLASTVVLSVSAFNSYEQGDKTFLLPDATSHGHYQIEMRCETCHTPMQGVKQDACLQCHAAELSVADDSHPAAKFRDPRNAELLARIDALKCVTCHREHRPDETLAMGVTEPEDLCVNCHSDIGEERPSHEGMAFTTCSDSGCHNFHDNRTLNADFLEKHAGEPAMLAASTRPEAPQRRKQEPPKPDAPADKLDTQAIADWSQSGHAGADVNCMDCHEDESGMWQASPDHTQCATCHGNEQSSFLRGRHGMRLAQGLSPMRPALARLPMKQAAHNRELTCNACHGAHRYDRNVAAVAACLTCHKDEHSVAYSTSPHGRGQLTWSHDEERSEAVTCATCHLPEAMGEDGPFINHNQNDNLRPRSKMLKDVCGRCHGIEFSIDALADPALIRNNFSGQPSLHVESVDMVMRGLSGRDRK